jgi:adenosine deaminase
MFLKRLPKVSLHVHLAGTVQPSTLAELARKNGVALPAYREPADLYDYPDIYQFLTMLDLVMASVRVVGFGHPRGWLPHPAHLAHPAPHRLS